MCHWHPSCLNFLLTLMLLVLGHLAPPAHAADASAGVYRVIAAKAPVFAWGAQSSRWRPIAAGSRLPAGTLVQVGPSGSLTLTWTEDGHSNVSEEGTWQLSLNRPVTLRLDTSLRRQINIREFRLDRTQTTALEDKSQLSWEDAWERFAAVFSGIPETLPISAVLKRQQDVWLAQQKQRLHLIAPRPVELAQGEKGRSYEILWREKSPGQSKSKEYLVYVWTDGKIKPEPFAKTRSLSYQIILNSYGFYNVQVTSTDGQSSTPIHQIQFLPAIHSKNGMASVDNLEPVFPRSNGLIMLQEDLHKENKAMVPLAWRDLDCLNKAKVCRYHWTIIGQSGDHLHHGVTTNLQAAIALPPGRYSWTVRKVHETSSDNFIGVQSKGISFEVRSVSKKSMAIETLWGQQILSNDF